MFTVTSRSRLTLGLAVALAGLVSALPSEVGAAAPANGDGAVALGDVDELVEQFMDDEDVVGATVAITKGSRLVWSKGYGYADTVGGIPMTPEHRSRIGSTSKVITAIAAMQLVEQGTLDLDQPVYGAHLTPVWGSEWGTVPGVIVSPDGALDDASDYAVAMIDGVAELGELFPPAEHLDEFPSLPWALLTQAAYKAQIDTTLTRASHVKVRNVLSHTAGYLDSGSPAKQGAADHFGVSLDDVTSAQYHQAVLLGTAGAPFPDEPGQQWSYSNHGFSVAGLLIEEASSEASYRDHVDAHLLAPLGLNHVVPNNDDYGPLDAVPYSTTGALIAVDPTVVSRLGISTGGWSASARDLARILCSIDPSANNARSLQAATVSQMAADAEPGAAGVNPIGWDSASATQLTKNGAIPGGSSRVAKFPKGAFAGTSDEINVAVAVNQSDRVPPTTFLHDLAGVAAASTVPAAYDLFDPGHRCRTQPGLADQRPPRAGPAP